MGCVYSFLSLDPMDYLQRAHAIYDAVINLWNTSHRRLQNLEALNDMDRSHMYFHTLQAWEKARDRVAKFQSTPEGKTAWMSVAHTKGAIYEGDAIVRAHSFSLQLTQSLGCD